MHRPSNQMSLQIYEIQENYALFPFSHLKHEYFANEHIHAHYTHTHTQAQLARSFEIIEILQKYYRFAVSCV